MIKSFICFRSEMLKKCWRKDPSKRPTASEILEVFTYSPRLVCPSIDVPMASVQIERSLSFEVVSKPTRKPSDLLNLKLLISSDHRNSDDESYSPMTGLTMSPLHTELLLHKHDDVEENEEENYDQQNSPFLPDKHSYDSDLIDNYVDSGYMVCNSWNLSNSLHSSNETV